MTKEKVKSLIKYAADMKARLESLTPSKWAHAPVQYSNFLTRELRMTLAKIEADKLEAPKAPAK